MSACFVQTVREVKGFLAFAKNAQGRNDKIRWFFRVAGLRVV